MPTFTYVARDAASGREVQSSLEAVSEQAAVQTLLGRNMLVVSIQEKATRRGKVAGGSVGLQDLVIFTRQLATMVDAGLAIVQSLQALADQTTNKVMRDVIRDVCTRVEGGDNFSAALQKHPKVFVRLYTCMVDAGEKGGLLAEILGRLATYLENTARLRKKVKSAMMYPTVVTLVAIGITVFLLVRVVPVFKEVFEGFGAPLPGPTKALIAISDWMKQWYLLVVLIIGGVVYGFLAYIKTKAGEEVWDRVRIRIPIFGAIAHKICLARFTRTFASLVRSGVPILEVLNIVANTCGNAVMEKATRVAASDIEKGEGISTALSKHPIFPTMIIRMLTAGEQTGKIDQMLERVADFLDEEIETTLGGLTSLIEPLLIVFLGVVIGGLVICMFMPIFKLGDIVSGPQAK
ncbi:MAG: type II secretion system F family protein [Verrucomicrobia bacterium]|nr:type II secretion system F family protein [Verrucomicrobiota bacterium]